ncbi:MAG: alanine racemase [bacterium F082]|nr:MAG: alanine racemase [bacterium F082]KWW27833.1 MAG: alanine racemase [bacterium P201]
MVASELSSILDPQSFRVEVPDSPILHLATDSRRVADPQGVLFFAIPTRRNDGSRYIVPLYKKGVRNFVAGAALSGELRTQVDALPGANLWYVDDVIASLQRLAASHRAQFHVPVVGITGSNGKTVVKDWLLQLFAPGGHPVASPRSYNSQIGVPLSVWQMESHHDIAFFEAGISMPGEMSRLQAVIQPTVGILTNIAASHDENFVSRRQKLDEKLQLFIHSQALIYNSDDAAVRDAVAAVLPASVQRLAWGSRPSDALCLLHRQVSRSQTTLSLCWRRRHRFELTIPFVDRASTENVMHCATLMLHMGVQPAEVARRCAGLKAVATRLRLDEGVNGCLLLNDSYSLDLDSLAVALDFMQQESQHKHRTLILSDFVQPDHTVEQTLDRVVSLLRWSGVDRFIGIGDTMLCNQALFVPFGGECYATVDEFLRQCAPDTFRDQTVLLKGGPGYGFERIVRTLRQRSHETVMQVDLSAMVHNLNYYRSLIRPTTKLMAMVKASSYGAGKVEVAGILQYHRVDYLTVAYIDEGIELRRNGITLPVMVMNPEEDGFDDMIRHRLEPDIYSFRIFDAFARAARPHAAGGPLPVHIEVDTGMHRLGFDESDLPLLARRLSEPGCPMRVVSLFSHLACSEDPAMDRFTRGQISRFTHCCDRFKADLRRDDLCCHILNSSGITRFPEAQLDMVRLGIGLYGVSPEPAVQACLQPVSRLVTHISQIKVIPAGDSVGYGRRWVAPCDSRIAILSIGYADGLSRHLGNGHGRVVVGGLQAPIIGSVCMDMCFVDVTGIDCREGDEVTLFGDTALLQQMADAAGTIAYEILTSVSPRVKRVYYQE